MPAWVLYSCECHFLLLIIVITTYTAAAIECLGLLICG